MKNRVKYVTDFESLETALSNMNCIKPFNIYVGVLGDDKYLDKHVVSDYAFSILINSDFYNQYERQIEQFFYRNAEIRKNKILESIRNNDSSEHTLYISIDKYHYDDDFIKNVINLEDKRSIVLSFFGVKPSEGLLFLLKKNKVDVYLYNSDAKSIKVSDKWFTKSDFKGWENDGESYEMISYNKLINNLDCLEKIMALDSFSITNVSDSIGINELKKTEYKTEINSVYLNKIFNIVKKLRRCGYDKPINIRCDSLCDINNSLFNYETLGVTFGSCELDIKNINSLFYRYRSIAQDTLNCNDMTLSEKLNYIFITLSNIIASEKDTRKKLEMLFFKKEMFMHTYDLCKLFGLKPIKCSNTSCYYFFEEHNPNVVRFNPAFFDYVFGISNIDINDIQMEQRAWDVVYKSYNDILDKKSNSLEKYLCANSVDEIKEIFIDSVDLSDGLYLDVKDRYIDEFNYLINILMDLSEDDYLEFKNSQINYNSVQDVISDCERVADMILKNKKKQIGIVMTKSLMCKR